MFHKEGFKIILGALFVFIAALLLIENFVVIYWLKLSLQLFILSFLVIILQFFRNPNRTISATNNIIVAPVDGKVVVIEEVFESEYFKDKRMQVSIFMSPINVHVTRYAVSGKVKFSKYHPGKFLVAWHPKASTENERTTVVIENEVFWRNNVSTNCRSFSKKNYKLRKGRCTSCTRNRCWLYKIWLSCRFIFTIRNKN